MKYLISIIFALLVSVAACSQSDEPKKYKDTSEVPRITLEDAKKAFDDKTAVFIDARSAEIYKAEHIKGAINMPYSTEDFSSLPKGKTIIVYCS